MGRRNQLAAVNQTFNPATIAPCSLWLDASDTSTLTLSGSSVTAWLDKAGNRSFTQATGSFDGTRSAPTQGTFNGRSVVTFNGTNQVLRNATADLYNDRTTFAVLRRGAETGARQCAFADARQTFTSFGYYYTLAFDLTTGNALYSIRADLPSAQRIASPFAVAVGDAGLFCCQFRNAQIAAANYTSNRFVFNDTAGVSGSGSNYSASLRVGITLGATDGIPGNGYYSEYFAGSICEIISFDAYLTSTQIATVNAYLSAKWNLPVLNNASAVASPLDIPNCAIWLDGADTSTMYTTASGPVNPVTAPTDIANCAAWYDAADSSTLFAANTGSTPATTTVGRWANKSGSAENRDLIQSDAAARPTIAANVFNGKPALVFDGVNDFLQRSFTLGFPTTLFVVFAYNSPYSSTTTLIDGAGTGNTLRIAPFSETELLFYTGAASPQMTLNANTLAITRLQMVSTVANGTSSGGWRNALDAVGSAYTTSTVTAPSGLTLCSWGAFGLQYANASVAEVIVYNAALSAADRVRVERYLSLKWGVPGVHATVAQTGDPVRYWGDKSGNNRHFTPAASVTSRPTCALEGRPGVSFNASPLLNSTASLAVTSQTTIVVTNVDNALTNSRVFSQSPTGQADFSATGHYIPLMRNLAQASISSQADSNNRATVSLTTGAPAILASVHTGTVIQNYVNSVSSAPYTTTSALNLNVATFSLMGDTFGGAANTIGRVSAVIVYNRALTSAELASVARYLNNRYGVGLIPPVASHPDAQRWVQQVYLNGGTCSQNTVDAVSSFCREIDSAGLRSKFYRLNLFCGNELIACRTPLYRGPNVNERHGFDLDVLTVGSGGSSLFTNTDYTEYGINGGLAGRLQTTTNFNAGPGLRTGLVPAFIPAFYGPQRPAGPSYNYSSLHLATYIRKMRPQTLGTGYLLGAYSGIGRGTFDPRHGAAIVVNQNAWRVGTFSADVNGTYDNVDRGLYVADIRVTNALIANDYVNELTLYAGGMRYATGQLSLGPFLNPNTDFGVFGECRTAIAYSQNDNSFFRAEQTMQGYSIGLGMTEAEVQVFNQIMNRFQNRLGRGLPENTMPAFSTITNLDTQDWLTRVYAAGGNVSTSTAEAVQTFCNAVTTAGIRDRFFRLNLFCGNNIEACVVPLYRGPTRTGTQYGGLTDRNSNFVSADYVERGAAGGLQGNGTNKYLDTALAGAELAAGNRHVAAYEIAAATTTYSPSVLSGSASATMHGLGPWTSTTHYRYRSHNTVGGNAVVNFVSNGFWLGSDTAATASALYRNGSSVASVSGQPTGGSGNTTYQVLGHTSTEFSEARLGGYSVGLSLTAQQVAAFNTAMQAFQTALSRNV